MIPMNLALMKTFVLSPFNSFGLAAFLLTLLTIIFVTPSKAELVFGMTIFFLIIALQAEVFCSRDEHR